MLVLSRKEWQTIVIGENVTVTVCRINDDKVRLGVDAPDDVNIRRGELPAREGPRHA